MAVTLINSNLHLSSAQLSKMEEFRDNKGYHVYFKGDGVKDNPFTFNLTTNVNMGRPSAAIALSMVGKNIKFTLALKHFTQSETLSYSQSYEGEQRKASGSQISPDGSKLPMEVTDYVVTEGVHIVRATLERRINLYVDDHPLLKHGKTPFGTLSKLVVEGNGLTVYEAHFTNPGGSRIGIFSGNGMEMPETPTLYPSTYVQFSGKPLEHRTAWLEIRPTLKQKEAKQVLPIRREAGPIEEAIQVVVKFFEEHISLWTSEGIEDVQPAKHRTPRSLSVYEFTLYSMLMCLPSS